MMTSNNFKKRSGIRHAITTLVTAAAFIFQTMMPVYAAVLSDSAIQSALDANAQFERDTSKTYQYIGSPVVAAKAPTATHIEAFYDNLHSNYKHALEGPNYVPIGLDGITLIIPTYERYKTVGDPLVQSRYIRAQISAMLGRTLIDTQNSAYNSEAAQLNTLYANAVSYVQSNPNQKIGTPLGLNQDASGLGLNMVWPELRRVNGEQVLVPIVYLTDSTVQAHKVTGNTTQANGPVSLSSLIIEGVTIQLGRDAFLNVVNDLINSGGQITGTGNLNINVGGQLHNVSGIIEAEGDLVIGAKSITNRTLVYRYDLGNEQGGYFGEIARIEADGSVVLRAYEDIVIAGASVSAGQDIKFGANGNIYIGTVEIVSNFSGSEGGWRTVQRSGVEYLGSSLTAVESIELIAAGEILIDYSEIVADNGHIELLAGLGITVEDSLNSSQEYKQGKFGSTSKEVSAYKTVAMRSLLDAGKDIRIHAEFGDITLKAVDISSSAGTSVSADSGGVNLLVTRENDHYSYSSVRKSLFTVKTVNRGHDIETVVPNTIVGGFQVDALSGVKVEYEGDASLSLDEQVAELAQMPGLEWMAQVQGQTSAEDWTAVESKYREWNERHTSLSAAALALIVIVVTVVTAGAGSGAAAGSGGAAGGATAGGAAATTATTFTGAQFIGASALNSVGLTTLAVNGTAAAAVGAASVSLITAASIASANALVNGEGLDGAFEASFRVLTDDEALMSAAVAAVTAGALEALDGEFFRVGEGGPNGDSFLFQASDTAASGFELTLGGQAIQVVTHAAVRAGVQNIANGADIEEVFLNALATDVANILGEELASAISSSFEFSALDGELNLADTFRYISHAATGCIVGSISAGINDQSVEELCYSGVGGAVFQEVVSDVLISQNNLAVLNQELGEIATEVGGFLQERLEYGDYDLPPSERLALSRYSLTLSSVNNLLQSGVNVSRLGAALLAFSLGASAEAVTFAAETGATFQQADVLNNTAHRAVRLADEVSYIQRLIEFNDSIRIDIDLFSTQSGGQISEMAAIMEGADGGAFISDTGVELSLDHDLPAMIVYMQGLAIDIQSGGYSQIEVDRMLLQINAFLSQATISQVVDAVNYLDYLRQANGFVAYDVFITERYNATLYAVGDGSNLIQEQQRTLEELVAKCQLVNCSIFTDSAPLSITLEGVTEALALQARGLIEFLNEFSLEDFVSDMLSSLTVENLSNLPPAALNALQIQAFERSIAISTGESLELIDSQFLVNMVGSFGGLSVVNGSRNFRFLGNRRDLDVYDINVPPVEIIDINLPHGQHVRGEPVNLFGLAPEAPTPRYLVTPDEAGEYLRGMGIPEANITSIVESFDGQQIYIRHALPGENFYMYSGADDLASGQYLASGAVASTPREVIDLLALPTDNDASRINIAVLNQEIGVLEGVVASQPLSPWVDAPRSGGGWQTFVPGGREFNTTPVDLVLEITYD